MTFYSVPPLNSDLTFLFLVKTSSKPPFGAGTSVPEVYRPGESVTSSSAPLCRYCKKTGGSAHVNEGRCSNCIYSWFDLSESLFEKQPESSNPDGFSDRVALRVPTEAPSGALSLSLGS